MTTRRAVWCVVILAGCATPVRYTEKSLTRYDKTTEYRIDDRADGFTVFVEYARYPFIPESSAVATACRATLTSLAYETAEARGRKILVALRHLKRKRDPFAEALSDLAQDAAVTRTNRPEEFFEELRDTLERWIPSNKFGLDELPASGLSGETITRAGTYSAAAAGVRELRETWPVAATAWERTPGAGPRRSRAQRPSIRGLRSGPTESTVP